MGYDTGNVIANLIFAYDNGIAYGEKDFCEWIISCIKDTVDLFVKKFIACYDENVTDVMAKVPGFRDYYLGTILRDTASYAGTELIRRTVGMAQVKDVNSIEDPAKKAEAKRLNILCAKDYILNCENFKTGDDFIAAITRAAKAAK